MFRLFPLHWFEKNLYPIGINIYQMLTLNGLKGITKNHLTKCLS
jgi:hypothetical protein